MHSIFSLGALALLASMATAHMEMSFPPPLRGKTNPHATNVDFDMTAPLVKDGSNFPCKGYQADLGTPAGAPTADFSTGGSYNFTIVGGAAHNGGSCQLSLSYDQGKSFKVIHSYIGNCPLVPSFDFTIPSDAPTGNSLMAWTWFNKVGNREMYMNCASVTISGGSKKNRRGAAVPFSSRPDIMVANLNNGCTILENFDYKFPNPGPDADVTVNASNAGSLDSINGVCAPVNGIGGGESGSGASSSGASSSSSSSSSGSGSGSSSSGAPSSAAAPAASGFATSASPTPSGAAPGRPAAPAIPATGLKVSADGQCSGTQTCTGAIFGSCCSKWGYCGNTNGHCLDGCQAGFGACGAAAMAGSVGSGAASAQAATTGKASGSGSAVPVVASSSAKTGKPAPGIETSIILVTSTLLVTASAISTHATSAASAASSPAKNSSGFVTKAKSHPAVTSEAATSTGGVQVVAINAVMTDA